MSKITIIIPVYNAEETIERCLNSLLCQSFKDFSIIVVNDGPRDNTQKKLQKYSQNKKIKIIQTTNKGVSAARNLALRHVNSEYVGFVDADDYVEPNYLQDLLNGITYNADIDLAVINIDKLDSDKKVIYHSDYINGIMDARKFVKYILDFNGPGGFLWNKLFKKKIIYNNFLSFDSELNVSEDLLFCIKYLKECNLVKILNTSGYNYVVTKNGITGKGKNKENKIQFLFNYRLALRKIKKELSFNFDNARPDCEARIVQVDGTLLWLTRDRKSKRKIRLEIKENLDSFRKSRLISNKQKIILFIIIFVSYFY